MSPQEQKYYNETILPRLQQLKLSPNSSYGLQVSDIMLARYRQSQKNQQRVQQNGTNLKPQMLDEVTVTAPKLTAKTTDNSDTTPLTKETSWTSELDNETKTALGNGINYDASKARSGEREAQAAANKVGLGLGAIGLSTAAAPVIGTLIGEGLKVAPMFLDAIWNPGNYLSYLGPNAAKAAPYLNAVTHSAGYTGSASNLYGQVTKDRSNQTVLDNAKDGALAALDLSLLSHGYSKVYPYTKAAYNAGKAAIENASVYFRPSTYLNTSKIALFPRALRSSIANTRVFRHKVGDPNMYDYMFNQNNLIDLSLPREEILWNLDNSLDFVSKINNKYPRPFDKIGSERSWDFYSHAMPKEHLQAIKNMSPQDFNMWVKNVAARHKQLTGKSLTVVDGQKLTPQLKQEIVNRWNALQENYGRKGFAENTADLPDDEFYNLLRTELEKQNTFVRGVRLKPEDLSLSPEKQLERYKQYAIEFAPNTGSGRAGFDSSYRNNGIGTIYTSNSVDQASAYATPSLRNIREGVSKTGKIVTMQYPLESLEENGGNYLKWISRNLPIGNSVTPNSNIISGLGSDAADVFYQSPRFRSRYPIHIEYDPKYRDYSNEGINLFKNKDIKIGNYEFRVRPRPLTHFVFIGPENTKSPLIIKNMEDPSWFNRFRSRYHLGRVDDNLISGSYKQGGTLKLIKKYRNNL